MYKKVILAELEAEEVRIKSILADNAEDFEELQPDWQERDSPAERNLREVEWSQYEALSWELVEIADAKSRLNDDTYGICEDCGVEISKKRLTSILTPKRSISCQEKVEKQAGAGGRKVSL